MTPGSGKILCQLARQRGGLGQEGDPAMRRLLARLQDGQDLGGGGECLALRHIWKRRRKEFRRDEDKKNE